MSPPPSSAARPPSGANATTPEVRWARLRPDDFRARRDACPVVYLPLGLCEPHGHVAALGLDLLKADYYCDEAARRFGGVVAPSQGYHIHECGFHAPWLAEVVGDENPLMAALPPHVMAQLFLYQLRAFARAGFRAVVALSGHGGGSQHDLRRVAAAFTTHTGVPVVVQTDAEWVAGRYPGDHAGRFEISQLLAIAPECVDLSLLARRHETGSGGRLALGDDAGEATRDYGHLLNEAILAAVGDTVAALVTRTRDFRLTAPLAYEATERLWADLAATLAAWKSMSPAPQQPPVPPSSAWSSYVHPVAALTRGANGPGDAPPGA